MGLIDIDGFEEGTLDGSTLLDGDRLGSAEGCEEGTADGPAEGSEDGSLLG